MTAEHANVQQLAARARQAFLELLGRSGEERNRALQAVADDPEGLALDRFPFATAREIRVRGMPVWAQEIGSVLPLTHYLRLVRGIILKGIGWQESLAHVWPIAVFWLIVVIIGVKRYRQTLD